MRAATEQGSFDRWQRQMRSGGPRPGWSVEAVFDWAQQAVERGSALHVPAARCLSAVAGPEDRPQILRAARDGSEGARCAALHYLAEAADPAVLDLIETAATGPARTVADAAVAAFERMTGTRPWSAPAAGPAAPTPSAPPPPGCSPAGAPPRTLPKSSAPSGRPYAATDPTPPALVPGRRAGRLGIACAAPVLRHIYRETSSSHLRGRTARALAATDPSFATGFAVECLWDCEETTREVAALHAETGDIRVAERLRRLAADPAEEAEVQTAVRSRIGPDAPAL